MPNFFNQKKIWFTLFMNINKTKFYKIADGKKQQFFFDNFKPFNYNQY